jgi:hypothetical protein
MEVPKSYAQPHPVAKTAEQMKGVFWRQRVGGRIGIQTQQAFFGFNKRL